MSIVKYVKIPDGFLEETLASAHAPVVTISELIKNSSDACIKKHDVIKIDISTKDKSIVVKDNGGGFSAQDIEDLGDLARSKKMSSENTISKIGEPYAGSKGLGLLTAFNLCDKIEILTYSIVDDRSYKISWEKGTETVFADELNYKVDGTELKLVNVSEEKIKLIMMEDEISKLFSSSINYYIDRYSLPIIEIRENGEIKAPPQKIKIEELYKKYRSVRGGKKGFFVAKATFRYSSNKLYLSYEDNQKNIFNFDNEEIDLTDVKSLTNFLDKKNVVYKGVVHRNHQKLYEYFDSYTELDDFSGVYYIWRDRKEDDNQYPCGVRVYVNNYGLYDYLNNEDDWLSHSEISQNVSATNYKLKNTYGYVVFDNFNESQSQLKISKARNNFMISLAEKKFRYIMRGFVSGIFSSIDITIKDPKYDTRIFEIRQERKNVFLGDVLNIKDLLRTTLPFNQVQIECDNFITVDEESGNILVSEIGQHEIRFFDGLVWLKVTINVREPIPNFDLTRSSIKKMQGETIDLTKFINKKSVCSMDDAEIKIISIGDDTIIRNNIFCCENYPGIHVIKYLYEVDGNTLVSKLLEINVEKLYKKDSNKFSKIFTHHNYLSDYVKIHDIIDDISNCYMQYPTISMISLRSLIEVSIRSFLEGVCEKEVKKDIVIGNYINQVAKEVHDKNVNIHDEVMKKYEIRILRGQKNLNTEYQKMDLNYYVHSHDSIPSSDDILQIAKKFSFFINFIIEALLRKQNIEY